MNFVLWDIEKIISKGDYYYCIVRDHPNRTKNNYVLLHRVIMENHLKRLLSSDEVVHHKNENKKDNRIENLEVLSASEHSKHHNGDIGRTILELKCPECLTIFTREKRQTHVGKKQGRYTCCSLSCRSKFSRKIQLGRDQLKTEELILENIIREFNSLGNI